MPSTTDSRPDFPKPPYYAVIFTNQRSDSDDAGYAAMAERMDALAREQPGYLGIESVRDVSGQGVTISYWTSLEAIRAWREQAEHRIAQAQGKSTWYTSYSLRVCKVEEARQFMRPG